MLLSLLSGCSAPVTAAPEPARTPYEVHAAAGLALAPGFEVVVVEPWVVFGHEPGLTTRAQGTVAWATGLLKADYFPIMPGEPVDVWLFEDAPTYEHHVTAWFDSPPDTPYGFANDRGLFMDISTGGGTLVHEMVHPLMDANFPGCPPWFNEGLASLYEAVNEKDGHLNGLLNWRLAGLQEQIRQDNLPSFQVLMAQDSNGFYNQDTADNYAQSRYLLYWLQEEGRLRPYYQAFTANADADPTGFDTLKTVLGRDDMDAFQGEWEAWALALSP